MTHIHENHIVGATREAGAAWRKSPSPAKDAPDSINVSVEVTDAVLVEALSGYPEGRARDDFVMTALRIGIAALQQAQGQVDASAVRDEGERLTANLKTHLDAHRERVSSEVGRQLQEYFDPDSGRFNERVSRLLKKDGELETVLRNQLTGQDSELARTLVAHVGETSPLMKLLDPDASSGLLRQLHKGVERALKEDRDRIVAEFSLDNDGSALRKLVSQISDSNGKLTSNLQNSIDAVMKEFSLDHHDSALSHLVKQVEQAQKKITTEFSLDSEASALARLKKELTGILSAQATDNRTFQQEVREALASMQARREEAQRSTAHGTEFEHELYKLVEERSLQAGDIPAHVGNTTGQIRNNKKGDMTIEIGPDHIAAGSRIVIEAKQDASYDLAQARTEMADARKNRAAEIGVFVFSSRTAPDGLDAFARFGSDIFIVWDVEDQRSDVLLDAAVSVAKALCTKSAAARSAQSADFDTIDRSVREIEKQVKGLEDIRKWTETIKNSSNKILDKVGIMGRKLSRQIGALDAGVEDLKDALHDTD